MNRPILIACTGYIIGIIIGLYIRFSIVLLFLFLALLIIRKYNKYLKVIIKTKILIIFLIFAIIGNINVQIYEKQYNKLYNMPKKVKLTAIVVTDKKEREYSNVYKIKVKDIGNIKSAHLLLKVKKDVKLDYGDLIEISGEYTAPDKSRNYKGYNYQQYLKTQQTFGTIEVAKSNIKIIQKQQLNYISTFANKAKNSIIKQINNILPCNTSSILCGILIGNKNYIEDDVIQNFKDTNLSHILAISGLHVSYIMLRSSIYTTKNKLSKEKKLYFFNINFNSIYVYYRIYTISRKSRNYGHFNFRSKNHLQKIRFCNKHIIIFTMHITKQSI